MKNDIKHNTNTAAIQMASLLGPVHFESHAVESNRLVAPRIERMQLETTQCAEDKNPMFKPQTKQTMNAGECRQTSIMAPKLTRTSWGRRARTNPRHAAQVDTRIEAYAKEHATMKNDTNNSFNKADHLTAHRGRFCYATGAGAAEATLVALS